MEQRRRQLPKQDAPVDKEFTFSNATSRRAWQDLVDMNNTLTSLRKVLGVNSYDRIGSVANKVPGYPAVAKLKAIMNRGNIWAALANDTPAPGTVLTMDDGLIVVVAGSFDLLWGVISIAECPTFAHVKNALPLRLWGDIFRWVAYMHPLYGNVVPAEDDDELDIAFAMFKALDCVARIGTELDHILLETPSILPIFLDCWLHYPSYVNPHRRDAVADCPLIIAATSRLIKDVESDLVRSVMVSDLRRLCRGKNETAWRLFGEQTRYLATLEPDYRFEWYWERHFELAIALAHFDELKCDAMPRKVLTTIIDAARHCLTRRPWHRGVAKATDLLWAITVMSDNHRNLIRVVRAGVIHLLYDISKVSPSIDTEKLCSQLAAGLWFPKVLRAFSEQDSPTEGMESIAHDMSRPLGGYKEVLAAYKHALKAHDCVYNEWRYLTPCRNSQGPHDNTIRRVCPCGMALYCSGSCQRMHWCTTHRTECGNRPWGPPGQISLKDKIHISVAMELYLQENRQGLIDACRGLPNLLSGDGVATLLINFCQDGKPAHQVLVHNNIQYRMHDRSATQILIYVRYQLGGKTHMRDLPISFILPEDAE